jgi:hypothetical protein
VARFVAVEAEVVHRIAIDRPDGDLLVVEEDGLRHRWPRLDHVAVGENDAALGVDDEAGGGLKGGMIGVEGARHAHPQHHHRGHYPVECRLPVGGGPVPLGRCGRSRKQQRGRGQGRETGPHHGLSLGRMRSR